MYDNISNNNTALKELVCFISFILEKKKPILCRSYI